MDSKDIIQELRTIEVHATLTQQLAVALIRKIEGVSIKKRKKSKGLTEEEKAQMRAHMNRVMLKKPNQ